jgi:hypothetical protein
MKTLIILMSMLLVVGAFPAVGQESKATEEKLTRQEKKELKKQREQEQLEEMIALLNEKYWVIEAHTVFDRSNNSFQISPTLNFVAVNGDKGVIQLGFNNLIGWNGVGGVTVDGQITKYEIKEGKKNQSPQATLRFQGKGGVGSALLVVTVNSYGQATARVSGDFGGRLTFQGQMVSLDKSRVYKGQSLF